MRRKPLWAARGRIGGFCASLFSTDPRRDGTVQMASCTLGMCGGGGGRKQVSKRSTHARPGMHMQQCSAVPCDHWYDTYVLPYNPLHLMALFCQHKSVCMLQDRERHPNATVFHPCHLAFAGTPWPSNLDWDCWGGGGYGFARSSSGTQAERTQPQVCIQSDVDVLHAGGSRRPCSQGPTALLSCRGQRRADPGPLLMALGCLVTFWKSEPRSIAHPNVPRRLAAITSFWVQVSSHQVRAWGGGGGQKGV